MVARILIVEDEANLRFSIRQTLRRAGHEAAEVASVHDAWSQTRAADFDAILTDVNLSGEDGIDLVRRLREDGYDGVIVVMTAFGTIQNAVSAMKLGADDYLQKPMSLEELVLLVDRLLENRKVRRRLSLYERLESSREAAQGIIGNSQSWKDTLLLAERLATAPVLARGQNGGGATGGALPAILILGETGTGKGLLARHIHRAARGKNGEKPDDAPFVHVNCSALPPSLVESELFGHEKGAFTDAKNSRPGLFEMAEGGTIFLDEIGDMPLDLQAKILTVVEEGIFRRVGGTRDKSVRARIITATNQPLEERVEQGRFRRDLLYRLNALTIKIPPLRDRVEDAVLIAQAMLERFAKEYGRSGTAPRLSEDAKASIRRHAWPGNVRELINMCQRAAMLCDKPEVGVPELGLAAPAMTVRRAVPIAPAPAVAQHHHANGNGTAHGGANGHLVFDFESGAHTADRVERELIIQALQRTRGNVSKAAKLIGMQRSSLRYRIERFGLQDMVQEIANR